MTIRDFQLLDEYLVWLDDHSRVYSVSLRNPAAQPRRLGVAAPDATNIISLADRVLFEDIGDQAVAVIPGDGSIQRIRLDPFHRRIVWGAYFAKSNRFLLVDYEGGVTEYINWERTEASVPITDQVQRLSIAPDAGVIAISFFKNRAALYVLDADLATFRRVAELATCEQLVFSPDSKWLASLTRSGRVLITDLASMSLAFEQPFPNAIAIGFDGASESLFVLEASGNLLVIEAGCD